MGILERVNRTLKCEFIFREEPKTKAELSALCADTELNSSSEMSEKRRHLFRAAQLRIFFYSLCFAALQVRSEK